MATTATHNSSRTTDESSEMLEQHLHDTAELESNTTGDYPPDERQGGIALADAGEPAPPKARRAAAWEKPLRLNGAAATTWKKNCGVCGSS